MADWRTWEAAGLPARILDQRGRLVERARDEQGALAVHRVEVLLGTARLDEGIMGAQRGGGRVQLCWGSHAARGRRPRRQEDSCCDPSEHAALQGVQ